MQQILAITRKELIQIAQKPNLWIVVFVVPILFIAIMLAVFGSSGTPIVTIFAVNQDRGAEAQNVMQALNSSKNLHVDVLATREEADRRVGAGDHMAAVIIPPGFSQDLKTADGATIEIIIDPARSEQANIAVGLVNAALSSTMIDAEVTRGVETGIDQALASIGQNNPTSQETLKKFLTAAFKGVVSSQVQDALNNPQVKLKETPYTSRLSAASHPPSLLDSIVPGFSLMFVFFLVSNLAVTLIEERQDGTMRRLLVMPVARSSILLGKMLPYFLIAVAQQVVVLTLGKLLFGLNLGHSVVGLAIIIAATSMAMAALGILIAALARSEGEADGLSTVIVLVMAAISGAMFPTIQIPGLQVITPHYWALQGFLNIISRGQGVEGTFLPAGVLLTMAAVFFTVGAVRFRFE